MTSLPTDVEAGDPGHIANTNTVHAAVNDLTAGGGFDGDLPDAESTVPASGFVRLVAAANEGQDPQQSPDLYINNTEDMAVKLLDASDIDVGYFIAQGQGSLLSIANDGELGDPNYIRTLPADQQGQILSVDYNVPNGIRWVDTYPTTEPDDTDIPTGALRAWYDSTAAAPAVNFKARDAAGDLYVATLPMTPA